MFTLDMSLLASFMNLAGPDLIVILLIILVLFGAKKLPELARGMGQAVKEFQKAKDEFNDELHKAGKSETEIAQPDVRPAAIDGRARRGAGSKRCGTAASKRSRHAWRKGQSGLIVRNRREEACTPLSGACELLQSTMLPRISFERRSPK